MQQSVEAGGGRARERILRAARRMFYERGIRAVGVEAIVNAAGVTKMSLYRHFASKDELVAACLAERIESYWRKWDECIVPHRADAVAQVLALLDWVGRRSTEPGFRGCPMTNAAIEFPEADHPGRKLAEAHKRELRERLLMLAVGGRCPRARDPGRRAATPLRGQLRQQPDLRRRRPGAGGRQHRPEPARGAWL